MDILTDHDKFVHLHLLTQFSLFESTIKISALGDLLKSKGMHSCAITDKGNMYGVVEFFNKMKAAGIKPIIGMEVYIAVGGRKKSHYLNNETSYYTGALLCKDYAGYRNLVKLSSLGYLEGQCNGIPRVDDELLRQYSQGLIFLSGGIQGELYSAIENGKLEDAKLCVNEYQKIFGENFYIELQRDGAESTDQVNQGIIRLAKETGTPLVGTNICCYPDRTNAYSHHILHLMGKQMQVTTPGNEQPRNDCWSVKSPEEMIELFSDYPAECISNTVRVAESCDVDLSCDTHYLPDYPCDEGNTLAEQFQVECEAGLNARLDDLIHLYNLKSEDKISQFRSKYKARLEFEINVIVSMKYAGYFLVVADFVQWAKKNGVSVGPGRGSGAGSITAYSLKITDIDPIRYDLLFERFLNPERVSMPDFDIDFEASGRDRVIDYVRNKYGQQNVCQISAISSLQAKGALKGVARVLGMNYSDADRLVKLVPNDLKITIEKALEESEQFRSTVEDGDDLIKQIVQISLDLEGMNTNLTTHAAGVIIMNTDITDVMPVCMSPQGTIQSQYTMEHAENQGAIKFDFLGLKNLSIIDEALRVIQDENKPVPDMERLSLDDPKVYKLLCDGLGTGIFQLESDGMKKLLRRMKPNCFEDIIALIALYRPGPLKSGMVNDFVARKLGQQEVVYTHEKMRNCLEETYGVMVYQEQVMKIAQELGGFTLAGADLLRRAIGKKKAEVLMQQRESFVKGCVANDVSETIANTVFDLIEKFAGYGFNKSHSAAYGLIGFQTAYLKAHYTTEFMVALLNTNIDNADNIVKFIQECRTLGIQILPPDINKSQVNFSIENKAIRFGLAGLKNISSSGLEDLLRIRSEEGCFKNMTDLYVKIDTGKLNAKALENLIKCGACDLLEPNRRANVESIPEGIEFSKGAKKYNIPNQNNLFDQLEESSIDQQEFIPRKIKDWNPMSKLMNECEILGFFATKHPVDLYSNDLKDISGWKNSLAMENNRSQSGRYSNRVIFPCVVSSVKNGIDRRNQKYIALKIEDKYSSMDGHIFSKTVEKLDGTIKKNLPYFIRGTFEDNDSGKKIRIQDMIPIREVRARQAKKLFLKITENDRLIMKKLKDLLAKNLGNIYLRLNLTVENNCAVTIETPFKFSYTDEVVAFLIDNFQPENLRFEFGKQNVLFDDESQNPYEDQDDEDVAVLTYEIV